MGAIDEQAGSGRGRRPGRRRVETAVDRTPEQVMRRRARTDANHQDIVQALRSCGWTVIDLSRVGCGVPDLLCARRGLIRLAEVKDGSKPPSARTLTLAEQRCHAAFTAAGVRVVILTSVDDALQL